MAGWVKLHRSLQDSSIASHPEYLAVWIHLMIRAQHSASECVIGRQIVKLNAGQLVFGRIKFSSEIGVSENKVRAALDVMKSLNMITIKSMAKFSIISITKWQEYQTESPANNHETANTSPADHQQAATYKNDKNVNNDKNIVLEQDKPAKKQKAAKADLNYSVWPQQPDQQILNDWIAMRKAKRAPLSQTVLDAFGGEFSKASTFGYSVNDCLRTAIASGWTGFKFSWMQNQLARGQQSGNHNQPRPSLIDRFIKNNYAGAELENDHRPMGCDDSFIRGEMVESVRGDSRLIGAMEADIVGDFKATGSGGFE